jgi:hypothetical protein
MKAQAVKAEWRFTALSEEGVTDILDRLDPERRLFLSENRISWADFVRQRGPVAESDAEIVTEVMRLMTAHINIIREHGERAWRETLGECYPIEAAARALVEEGIDGLRPVLTERGPAWR